MNLDRIYAPVRRDLEALDAVLRAELRSDDPFIGELVAYVLSTRGKLVRPALACLAAEAIAGANGRVVGEPEPGAPPDDRLYVAGTVELIHIASLIHDDIIDHADVRRGAMTVNVRWGNQVAVLLGDHLLATAFELITRVRHAEVAPAIAHAALKMSQAEIMQLRYSSEPHAEEEVYFAIIAGKTAHLFAAACRAGGLVAGADAKQAQALGDFGLAWGMSFQITDDALDLTSQAEHLGKPIGSDLSAGKVTLPLIHALRVAEGSDRRTLDRLLRLPDRDGQLEQVRAMLLRYGSLDYALDVARGYARQATEALDRLPPSPARESLRELTDFVLVRAR